MPYWETAMVPDILVWPHLICTTAPCAGVSVSPRSLFSFETVSHYVAQDGLQLLILLPQPPEFWITAVHHYLKLLWVSLQPTEAQRGFLSSHREEGFESSSHPQNLGFACQQHPSNMDLQKDMGVPVSAAVHRLLLTTVLVDHLNAWTALSSTTDFILAHSRWHIPAAHLREKRKVIKEEVTEDQPWSGPSPWSAVFLEPGSSQGGHAAGWKAPGEQPHQAGGDKGMKLDLQKHSAEK
jgi:hypothetical protein